MTAHAVTISVVATIPGSSIAEPPPSPTIEMRAGNQT
jgi:hypothetical protein